MSNYKNGGWDNKFIITKRSGKPIDSDAVYFVLRLDKDPNAIVAMEAYANSVEKINPKLARDIRNRLGACKRMAEIVQDQTLSELEAESESRTDRLLDELADNMAKTDEAMKPDKPLEQSEFTKIIRPRIDDDNFSQADMEDACDIIDRQTAEIKRLKSIICKMNPDIIIAPDKESLEELSEIAKIFGEQALERK